ncbi:cobalamin (vitamin B12) biosynthesis CbiX protein, partial [Saccharomonospora azurea SZMC 14600]
MSPRPVLAVVAHGSRDARSAATVRDLAAVLRRLDSDVDVRVSFLDLSEP